MFDQEGPGQVSAVMSAMECNDNMDLVRLEFSVEQAACAVKQGEREKRLLVLVVLVAVLLAGIVPFSGLPVLAVVLTEVLLVLLVFHRIYRHRSHEGRVLWTMQHLARALEVFCARYPGEGRNSTQWVAVVEKAKTLLKEHNQ